MYLEGRDSVPSSFVCPTCGGALWPREDGGKAGPDATSVECRIGHRFEAAQLWIEHCAARNRALEHAARWLAENAVLAHRLAGWTRQHGNPEAAASLEREAAEENRLFEQVRRMAEGRPPAKAPTD